MARTGMYSLNRKKDDSFRNFIFVLLAVLALLVLIYLVMAYGISSPKKTDDGWMDSNGNVDKLSGNIARTKTVNVIDETTTEFKGEKEETVVEKSQKNSAVSSISNENPNAKEADMQQNTQASVPKIITTLPSSDSSNTTPTTTPSTRASVINQLINSVDSDTIILQKISTLPSLKSTNDLPTTTTSITETVIGQQKKSVNIRPRIDDSNPPESTSGANQLNNDNNLQTEKDSSTTPSSTDTSGFVWSTSPIIRKQAKFIDTQSTIPGTEITDKDYPSVTSVTQIPSYQSLSSESSNGLSTTIPNISISERQLGISNDDSNITSGSTVTSDSIQKTDSKNNNQGNEMSTGLLSTTPGIAITNNNKTIGNETNPQLTSQSVSSNGLLTTTPSVITTIEIDDKTLSSQNTQNDSSTTPSSIDTRIITNTSSSESRNGLSTTTSDSTQTTDSENNNQESTISTGLLSTTPGIAITNNNKTIGNETNPQLTSQSVSSNGLLTTTPSVITTIEIDDKTLSSQNTQNDSSTTPSSTDTRIITNTSSSESRYGLSTTTSDSTQTTDSENNNQESTISTGLLSTTPGIAITNNNKTIGNETNPQLTSQSVSSNGLLTTTPSVITTIEIDDKALSSQNTQNDSSTTPSSTDTRIITNTSSSESRTDLSTTTSDSTQTTDSENNNQESTISTGLLSTTPGIAITNNNKTIGNETNPQLTSQSVSSNGLLTTTPSVITTIEIDDKALSSQNTQNDSSTTPSSTDTRIITNTSSSESRTDLSTTTSDSTQTTDSENNNQESTISTGLLSTTPGIAITNNNKTIENETNPQLTSQSVSSNGLLTTTPSVLTTIEIDDKALSSQNTQNDSSTTPSSTDTRIITNTSSSESRNGLSTTTSDSTQTTDSENNNQESTISTGLLSSTPGIATDNNNKTIEYETNPQISQSVSSISVSTNGLPTTTTGVSIQETDKPCGDAVCKKASSKWLAMMNHDEDSNPCKDFYDFACGGSNIIETANDAYFQSTFKALVAKTKEESKTSEYLKFFSDFYEDCNQYKDDFMMKDVLNSLHSIEEKSVTDIFIHLLLTQSMPFFDVGMRVNDTQSFGFELTLPEISSLKTSLSDWSLTEQIRQQCIEEVSDKISQMVNLGVTVEQIDECIRNNTTSYVITFVKEMEKMRELFTDKSLVDSFKTHNGSLLNIMDNLQDLLYFNYNISINTLKNNDKNQRMRTLNELNSQYKCRDLDWIKVFTGITKNVNITGEVPVKVYFPDHVDRIFNEFNRDPKIIKGILNLWYNIQLFRTSRSSTNYGRRATHCMKLATKLMPEISVPLIDESSSYQISPSAQYKRLESLFQQLKFTFGNSFLQAKMSNDSVSVLQKRLDDIQLRNHSAGFKLLGEKYMSASVYGNYSDMASTSYQQKIMVLLANYRKNVFSLGVQTFSEDDLAEFLLLYFVDPFEIEPKTFPPSRHIVYHPGFLHGISIKLPQYVELATKGFRLSQQIAKHFEKNDFSPNLGDNETKVYSQLDTGFETAERDLIGGINYTLDDVQYDVTNVICRGDCLNSAEIFEDNCAFRLVTDSLKSFKDTTILPFMKETFSTEQSFVTFIAHEFCQRQTLVDFVANFYGGRKLPAPVKIRNMIRNSDFFNQLYRCDPQENMNQFPYIVIYSDNPISN